MGIILSEIKLNQNVDKIIYKEEIKILSEQLSSLQHKIKEYQIPVLIVMEGWSSSGKGTLINRVLHSLDPRYFNVFTMNRISEEAEMRPHLWPYWIKTPSKGRIVIFDKSWNRAILPEGENKWHLTAKEKKAFYYDVNAFEKQLSDDGTVIIKFFLHIDKEEQKKRLKELEKNSSTKWRVDNKDLAQNRAYEDNLSSFDKMIKNTNVVKWHILDATDKKHVTIKAYRIIIDTIKEAIRTKEIKPPVDKEWIITPNIPSVLSGINPDKEIDSKDYKRRLRLYQKKISDLCFEMYSKRRSVAIVYEGWDASGKGGNIKRITQEIDPRGYEVVPISAPTQDELNHHYLWRFYNKLPKDGHLAIFDRSWYGRVMVERVEHYCDNDEWQRAYQEINDMEQHWANHGCIIFKFWMQIDKDEQLRRLNARKEDILKQYKITDEDWRNREKWDMYEAAVDEMLFKTNTAYAPWKIIESNNKKYARIETMRCITEELERRLRG